MKNNKKKKQIIVDNDLYNLIKGKMYAQGKTFSGWLEKQMQQELARR